MYIYIYVYAHVLSRITLPVVYLILLICFILSCNRGRGPPTWANPAPICQWTVLDLPVTVFVMAQTCGHT